MKKLTLILIGLITHNWLLGQPNLEIISNERTSEYYASEYRIPHGVGGATWKLLDTQGLEFTYNISDSPPKSWNKEIGNWFVSSDTIIFIIDQKISRAHENKIPSGRKYKTLIIKWSGTSKILPTWRDRPLYIDTNLIFLLDVDRKELADFSTDILRYFEESFKMTVVDQQEIFEVNKTIERLAKDFCDRKKVPYTQKIYFNGNLQKFF